MQLGGKVRFCAHARLNLRVLLLNTPFMGDQLSCHVCVQYPTGVL